MKKILVILFCMTIGLTVSNPAWAHGGGGGGGGGGGSGAGGAGEGGNGGGEGGSHGGGEGHGGGMGHGAGLGLGHSDADDTISSRSTQFAGQKGRNPPWASPGDPQPLKPPDSVIPLARTSSFCAFLEGDSHAGR